MPSILFVDEEAKVLEGLRDRLRKQRRRWDLHFAVGGPSAIRMLEERPFDVVLTDLRMPHVDGFALLDHLYDRHPATVRVVLSSDFARETACRLAPRAHRVLVKPCKPGDLETSLETACALGALIADEATRTLIGKISALPPMPQTYARLTSVLEAENASFDDVADVLMSDIALSARVLQLANSSYFGNGRPIENIKTAISLLGMETLRTVVLCDGIFQRKELSPRVKRFATALHTHSNLVARVAMEMTRDASLRRTVFATGLLHDLGLLVLALERDQDPTAPATLVDGCVEAPDHGRIGAYLLGLWGLPAQVMEAVAAHHDPETTLPLARMLGAAESIVDGNESTDIEVLVERARAVAETLGLG